MQAVAGPRAYAPAHALVDRAAEVAVTAAPGLDVERTVVRATPVGALLDASKDAAVVVVGSRGLGVAGTVLLGSVSWALSIRAGCPVLIVPTAWESRRSGAVGRALLRRMRFTGQSARSTAAPWTRSAAKSASARSASSER